MKKLILFFAAFLFILLYSDCKNCMGPDKEKPLDYTDVDLNLEEDGIEISRDQLVIRFPENTTQSEKDSIRKSVHASKLDKCSCGNNPIELWEIDTTKIDVEEAKRKTASNSGKGGVNGDHQFYIKVADSAVLPPSTSINQDIDLIESGLQTVLGLTRLGLSDSRVNLAVIDTGMDFKNPREKAGFLYDTSNSGLDCVNGESTGWNFVDGNKDITDSHSDGHGTFVTKTLMRELEEADIDFSILPIKAFDGKGESSYWNIICALNYLKELQTGNGDLHIVNASFGYDFHGIDQVAKRDTLIKYQREGIMAALIEDLGNLGTIVVASAGNENLDTDEPGNSHFPSGFTASNLIGVGGYIQLKSVQNQIAKTIAGNYGPVSIDLAAPYQIIFEGDIGAQQQIVKEGTSYGTPVGAAKLAQFIQNDSDGDDTPSQLISAFLASPLISTNSTFSEKVGMGRLISSEYQFTKDMRPVFEGGGVNENDGH